MVRSRARKKSLGEVFTPLSLVKEMVDRLPEETTDPTKTFCDPSCGHGNFLIYVVRRKIEYGSNALQALSTTYGVDIMQDNVDECRERIMRAAEITTKQLGRPETRTDEWVKTVNRNIVCADALKYHWRFDGT